MTTAVAVALYNGERFIEKQLDTLRLQTKVPEQVILCDDGSTDRTVEIVSEYIQKYHFESRWSLHINHKNLGYIKNFYNIMDKCETDIIFLCDQDDIWNYNKIEKMTEIFEKYSDISLLCCKFGLIDAENKSIHSTFVPKVKGQESLKKIDVKEMLRDYHWPGMSMGIKRKFYQSIRDKIINIPVPHDRILGFYAADKNCFYEFNYLGNFHRRHQNNTAHEEHRVRKILNLKSKLISIDEYNEWLSKIYTSEIPFCVQSKNLIKKRLELSQQRRIALGERNFHKLINVYRNDPTKLLRVTSFLCDIWLICFGNYK